MQARMTETETETGKYRLAWRSKVTGATGRGSPISREAAASLATAMNEKYPDLDHWAEPVDAAENEKDAQA